MTLNNNEIPKELDSELGNITIDFGYAVGDLKDAPDAKEAIKALMLELVDESTFEGSERTIDGKVLRSKIREL